MYISLEKKTNDVSPQLALHHGAHLSRADKGGSDALLLSAWAPQNAVEVAKVGTTGNYG